jgi:hypothetical protein
MNESTITTVLSIAGTGLVGAIVSQFWQTLIVIPKLQLQIENNAIRREEDGKTIQLLNQLVGQLTTAQATSIKEIESLRREFTDDRTQQREAYRESQKTTRELSMAISELRGVMQKLTILAQPQK